VARWLGPAAVPLGGRVLASRCPPWRRIHSCRRAPRRQGLNAVGYGGRSLLLCGTTPDVHLSKILIPPFIFRKSWQIKYKKKFSLLVVVVGRCNVVGVVSCTQGRLHQFEAYERKANGALQLKKTHMSNISKIYYYPQSFLNDIGIKRFSLFPVQNFCLKQ
jgi:hypothetical protein